MSSRRSMRRTKAGQGGRPYNDRSLRQPRGAQRRGRDLPSPSVPDYDEGETLVENMEALLEKERRLMEITLARKDRQLKEMEQKLQSAAFAGPRAAFAGPRAAAAAGPALASSATAPPEPEPRRRTVLDDGEALKRVRTLQLSAQGLTEESLRRLSRQIAFLPQVTSVDLSHNGLGDGCAHPLSALLSSSKSKLRSLNLASNRLGVDAAHSVCRALRRNRTLLRLDLSDNPFASVPMVGKMLGEMLSENHTLTSLKITIAEPRRDRDSGGRRGNTSQFAASIAQSPSITSLGMVGATLPRSTVAVLAHSIQAGHLVRLDLRFAFIGLPGAATLARALMRQPRGAQQQHRSSSGSRRRGNGGGPTTTALSTLVLSSNALGNAGCAWIARALSVNSTLTDVDLSSNGLGDDAAGSLADAIVASDARRSRGRSNSSSSGKLVRLDLSRNPFGEGKGGAALLAALQENEDLRDLGPAHELYFGLGLRRKLLEALRRNEEDENFARASRALMSKLLVAMEEPIVRPAVGLPSSAAAGEDEDEEGGREKQWVHAATLVLPSAVAAGGLLLEWEASLDKSVLARLHASGSRDSAVGGSSYGGSAHERRYGMGWRLSRSAKDPTLESGLIASGSPSEARPVREGVGAALASAELEWSSYRCSLGSDEVRVGDKVHLWLRASPCAHVRRLKLFGPDPIKAAAAAAASRSSRADPGLLHADGRDVVRHHGASLGAALDDDALAFRSPSLPSSSAAAVSLSLGGGFVLTHSVYLHAVASEISVEWEARAELHHGAALREPHSGSPLGVQWRVMRNNGSVAVASGAANEAVAGFSSMNPAQASGGAGPRPNDAGEGNDDDDDGLGQYDDEVAAIFRRDEISLGHRGSIDRALGFTKYRVVLPSKPVTCERASFNVADTLQLWLCVPAANGSSSAANRVHARRFQIRLLDEGATSASLASLAAHRSKAGTASPGQRPRLHRHHGKGGGAGQLQLELFGPTPFSVRDDVWA